MKHEVLQFADDRPSCTSEYLLQWASDAEDLLREMVAAVIEMQSADARARYEHFMKGWDLSRREDGEYENVHVRSQWFPWREAWRQAVAPITNHTDSSTDR